MKDGIYPALLDAPGLTNNITLSGLYAAQHVVAPIELGEFERRQMGRLIEDLNELQEQTGREVELTMVLPNRVDTRTKLDRQLLEETREQYGKLVAPKHIPQSQDVRNSQAEGKTLFALEEPSKTATRAIEAYETDADSLIQRLVGDVDLPTLTAVANETANDN
jgi:chromosome partitioning protein